MIAYEEMSILMRPVMRLRCAIIDVAVILGIAILFTIVLVLGSTTWQLYVPHRWLSLVPIVAVIWTEAFFTTTWGIHSLKLKLMRADGSKPSVSQCVARSSFKYSFILSWRVSSLIGSWGFINQIFIAISIGLTALVVLSFIIGVASRAQAYYDLWLGLRVCEHVELSQGFPVVISEPVQPPG